MNRKEPWEGCTPVVYHLPKFSRKSGWKVNGIRLFGSFYRKISGSNKTSEKVVLFFPDGIFQTEIRVPYLQSHLWNRVQAFAVVFGKWNWFVQMVNAIPGVDNFNSTFISIYPTGRQHSPFHRHAKEFQGLGFVDLRKCQLRSNWKTSKGLLVYSVLYFPKAERFSLKCR